jgi:hypothetical protein
MHRAQMQAEANAQHAEAHRPEPEPVHAVEPARQAEPEPAPVVQPAPPRAPRPAPQVDVRETLASAGLQLVETNPAKARQPLAESEPVRLGRPRRERPAEAQSGADELVQVETRNK